MWALMEAKQRKITLRAQNSACLKIDLALMVKQALKNRGSIVLFPDTQSILRTSDLRQGEAQVLRTSVNQA